MTELVAVIENKGGLVIPNSRVVHGNVAGPIKELVVETVGDQERTTLRCRAVVNAAGLRAQAVSRSLSGLASGAIPPLHFAKGSYFALSGASAPFRHLIYPLPARGGLGVHLTLDLAGAARFGPDTEWLSSATDVDRLDYAVDPARRAAFASAIRTYWPGLQEETLVPAYSGVRPKLVPEGHPAADFAVHGPQQTGCRGVVALYGIESPGLTASLALADKVVAAL